ncbi:MAG: hypothetical protein JW818_15885 [Pirellulales bacterium]|nr:hypothetical protein [Pirellulales bacterium]
MSQINLSEDHGNQLNSLDEIIDDKGTWLCEHIDDEGRPAPSTRLQLSETCLSGMQFRFLFCPDCGTYWRVWKGKNLARPSIEWGTQQQRECPPKYDRPRTLDIDQIILAVRHIPEITVRQLQGGSPTDDDGIWYFSTTGLDRDISLESGGNCPFVVETEEQSSADALRASSIEEAVRMITDYLTAASKGMPMRLKGKLCWEVSSGGSPSS